MNYISTLRVEMDSSDGTLSNWKISYLDYFLKIKFNLSRSKVTENIKYCCSNYPFLSLYRVVVILYDSRNDSYLNIDVVNI